MSRSVYPAIPTHAPATPAVPAHISTWPSRRLQRRRPLCRTLRVAQQRRAWDMRKLGCVAGKRTCFLCSPLQPYPVFTSASTRWQGRQ